jgi:CelD/BcsL family acetyltransferase involved in cellulose biosynthesis
MSAPTRVRATPPVAPAPPAKLAAEWDALATRAGADPFVRPGWIDAWRAAFGSSALEPLLVRRDGRLVGVLPVRGRLISRSPTNEHTPAFAPLTEDAEALCALAEALVARRPAVVSVAFLDAAEPALAALRAAAAAAGYAVAVRPIHRSPVLFLDDLAAWEATRPRRMIADLRRRRRRLEERGQLTVTTTHEPGALSDLLVLERSGWKGAEGTAIADDARLRAFYAQVAGWAARRGALRIATLRLDGRPLAALLALEEAGALHLLKAGYDAAFARNSPGQLLLQDTLRGAFAAGLARVELHGADEPYKRVWTGAVRERAVLEAFAPTAAGRLAQAAVARGRPLARRAREHRTSIRRGRTNA